MNRWSEILRSNRTTVVLFTVMVLLPSVFLTVVSLRAIRAEDARQRVRRTQRQRQIALLLDADLNDWLFSTGPDGASSRALLKFQIEDGRPVFPGLKITHPPAGPVPSSLRDEGVTPADEPVTDPAQIEQLYYPRVQAFLGDLKTGRNSGAQYFRRLKAMIVRMPDAKGYVLGSSRMKEHLNHKLTELTANEDFRSAIAIPETNESSVSAGDAIALSTFPAFYVTFATDDSAEGALGFRVNVFRYSMVLLLIVTVLGVMFMYRAASREAIVSQLQANFVSAVSHEFRTPLSSMLALTERLESSRVSDKQMLDEYHTALRRDAKRLSVLVDRLLDFAQLEEGKKTFSFTSVNLFVSAGEAVKAFQQSGRKPQVRLIDVDDVKAFCVSGDGTAIIQCLQNLIENAIKYSTPESPVIVRCGRENRGAFVEVEDHGIGIPASDRQKIFDKFYRAPNARSLAVQGTGIGLALVRRIMDAHNGSIEVESEPEKGSRFRLVFPNER